MRLSGDYETDGLFADSIRPGTKDSSIISKVHLLVTGDQDTGEIKAWYSVPAGQDPAAFQPPPAGTVREGVAFWLTAERRYAHNGSEYDERVTREFFPDLYAARNPASQPRDTQAAAAAIWPGEHLRRLDAARIARAKEARRTPFPGQLVGRHSLAAWGARLGNRKMEYEGGFAVFTPAMLTYGIQDVRTLMTLVDKIERKIADRQFTDLAWSLEQDFKVDIGRQVANGFAFDVPAAERLTAELQVRRAQIADDLGRAIAPFENHSMTDPGVVERQAQRVAKWEQKMGGTLTMVARGKVAGNLAKARTLLEEKRRPKVEVVPFSPGSRSHIARFLQERHGWKPDPAEGYTDDGSVKMDESVLAELTGRYPHIEEFTEYLVVTKVLGMLAEAKKKDAVPWIKMVAADGRIHGQVDHNGAVTSRCTHRKPNMTQVPKVGNPYGRECRALFVAGPGRALVGGDASGLELRMLAHYLHKYDGGEYMRAVTEGDVHTKNQKALGIPDGPTARDSAKRAIYAELYGAGERKLGWTIDPSGTPREQKARGRKAKQGLLANVKGLRALKDRTAELHEKFKSVNLPDGRRAWTRSDYAALNTLLQASGAIVMKVATVLTNRWIRESGLDARQVHQAHDELQYEVLAAHAAQVAEIIPRAITTAGTLLGIKCPLKGEAKVGKTWAETH